MEQLGFDFDGGVASIEGVVGRSPEPAEPTRLADAHKAADRVDVRARINREPPRTLADVLELVTEAPYLAPNRRRDLVSALRSLARMSRRPLSGLTADPRDLRVILDGIHPAAFEISAKRYANLRSDLGSAIALATGTKRGGRLHDVLTAEWRELRARCPSRWVEIKLHGFMRWCSDRKIVPTAVDEGTLAAFIEHRNCHDLKVDIPKLRRQVARAWNHGVDAVPEWPRTTLRHVPAQPRWTLPWTAFGAEFCADVARWAERLGGADLFDEDAPDKPLRPISIKQSRFCIQMAASTMVASGTALSELRALRDLVAPERMATILRGLRDRYDRKSQTPTRWRSPWPR